MDGRGEWRGGGRRRDGRSAGDWRDRQNGSVLLGGKWFRLFGLELGNGFVWQILVRVVRRVGTELSAEGFEAVEFLDRPAIHALVVRLVAEEGGVEFRVHAVEGFAEEVIGVLDEIGWRVEFITEVGAVVAGGREGLVEEAGEHPRFEAGRAIYRQLGLSDASDGVQFL